MAGRSAQSYKKCSIFNIFIRLGPFPEVFGQVKWWPILKLHEMMRVLHAVAFQIVFILSDDQKWQGGVLKVMKNHYFFNVVSRLDPFC